MEQKKGKLGFRKQETHLESKANGLTRTQMKASPGQRLRRRLTEPSDWSRSKGSSSDVSKKMELIENIIFFNLLRRYIANWERI